MFCCLNRASQKLVHKKNISHLEPQKFVPANHKDSPIPKIFVLHGKFLLVKELCAKSSETRSNRNINLVIPSNCRLNFWLACVQAPKWGIGRRQKSCSEKRRPHTALRLPGSPTFLFALYPTWVPVHRLFSALPRVRLGERGLIFPYSGW